MDNDTNNNMPATGVVSKTLHQSPKRLNLNKGVPNNIQRAEPSPLFILSSLLKRGGSHLLGPSRSGQLTYPVYQFLGYEYSAHVIQTVLSIQFFFLA